MFFVSLVGFCIIIILVWYLLLEPKIGQYIPEDWSNEEDET